MNGTDRRVAAALSKKERELNAAITRAVNLGLLELLRRVQQKLSGEVLHQRSGKLIGSAHVETAQNTKSGISGRVLAGAGAAWKYAPVHEYGGKGPYDIYPVNKKALAFAPSGSAFLTAQSHTAQRAFYFRQGKRSGSLRPKLYTAFRNLGGVVVKHVHHPPLAKRSFMRSSLEELRGAITARIYRAAAEAIRS